MKNYIRKIVSIILSATILLSLCACSDDKSKSSIIDVSDSIAEALVSCKVIDYEKFCDDSVKGFKNHIENLEDIFAMSDMDESQTMIQTKIFKSLSYKVDENSVVASDKLREGSIDVIFSYVDFAKLMKNEACAASQETFLRALEYTHYTVSKPITMEFEYVDNEWLLVNYSEIETLLSGMKCQIVFNPEYKETMSGLLWWNADKNNTYENCESIELYVELLDEYIDVIWEYYYTVEYKREVIYRSGNLKATGYGIVAKLNIDTKGCPLDETDSYIADGDYKFTFYDLKGNVIDFSCCRVVNAYEAATETVPDENPAVEPSETVSDENPTVETSVSNSEVSSNPDDGSLNEEVDMIAVGSGVALGLMDKFIEDEEQVYSTLEDGTLLFSEEFSDFIINLGWWDYDDTLSEAGFSVDTQTMAYSIKVAPTVYNTIYYEYYYITDDDEILVYSDTICPNVYNNGTFYDLDFTPEDGFAPGEYRLFVTDEAHKELILYSDIEVVK